MVEIANLGELHALLLLSNKTLISIFQFNFSFNPRFWSHNVLLMEGYQIEQGDAERYHRKINSLIDGPHPSVFKFLDQLSGLYAEAQREIVEMHLLGGDTSRRDKSIEARKVRIAQIINTRFRSSDQLSVLKSVVLAADADVPFKKIPARLHNRIIRSQESAAEDQSSSTEEDVYLENPTNLNQHSSTQLNPVPANIETMDQLGDDSNDFVYDILNLDNPLRPQIDAILLDTANESDTEARDFQEQLQTISNDVIGSNQQEIDHNEPFPGSSHFTPDFSHLPPTRRPTIDGKVVKATRAESLKIPIELPVDIAEQIKNVKKEKAKFVPKGRVRITKVNSDASTTPVMSVKPQNTEEVPKRKRGRPPKPKPEENYDNATSDEPKAKRKYIRRNKK